MKYTEINEGIEYYVNLMRNNAQSVLKNSNIDFSLLEKIYEIVFKKNLNVSNCDSCYFDAIHELRNIPKQNIKDMTDLKWKLKKGLKPLRYGGKFYSYKSTHITNEICEGLFKIHGKHIFEEIPSAIPPEKEIEIPKEVEIISEKKSVVIVDNNQKPEDYQFMKLKEIKELQYVIDNFDSDIIKKWKSKKQAIEAIENI